MSHCIIQMGHSGYAPSQMLWHSMSLASCVTGCNTAIFESILCSVSMTNTFQASCYVGPNVLNFLDLLLNKYPRISVLPRSSIEVEEWLFYSSKISHSIIIHPIYNIFPHLHLHGSWIILSLGSSLCFLLSLDFAFLVCLLFSCVTVSFWILASCNSTARIRGGCCCTFSRGATLWCHSWILHDVICGCCTRSSLHKYFGPCAQYLVACVCIDFVTSVMDHAWDSWDSAQKDISMHVSNISDPCVCANLAHTLSDITVTTCWLLSIAIYYIRYWTGLCLSRLRC